MYEIRKCYGLVQQRVYSLNSVVNGCHAAIKLNFKGILVFAYISAVQNHDSGDWTELA